MTEPTPERDRPLLVYDGDCAFCEYTVRYAERLTGDRVDYQPFQQIAARVPQISEAQFRASIWLAEPYGHLTRGAEAAFRTLAYAPGRGGWLRLYRHLPGFARVTEALYDFVSRRRRAAYWLSRLLWGPRLLPVDLQLTSALFLRLLALVYLAAFLSFGSQAMGLIGSHGILPLHEYTAFLSERLGSGGYWQVPFLFWLDASDTAIHAVVGLGALASVGLLVNVLPRLCLPVLYLAYLSLLYAGQIFMSYQWDILLVEVGFLAIFLPWHPRLVVWLYRWLLFRFMFMSGAVKLLSGDPTWADLTALAYHYETQPLPTLLAWYAHQLPEWWQRGSTAVMFAIELVLPFFIFLPRRPRFLAAWAFLLLELLILLTGNYNFFNLLTMLLCLLLFDDPALRGIVPQRVALHVCKTASMRARPGWATRLAVGAVAGLLVVVSALSMWGVFGKLPSAALPLVGAVQPLRAVNNYGLFAVMTTTRPEIVVEGSSDGEEWLAYEFRYKPGDLRRAPGWMIPHQPRLDWQMWFAALGDRQRNPWFTRFLLRLLENSPPVTSLLAHNPFAGAPPRQLRAQLYRYRFTDPETRAATGQWWEREPLGLYFPVISVQPSPDGD